MVGNGAGVGDGAGVMEIVMGVVIVYDGEAFCVAIWIVQVCGADALVVVILSVLCAYPTVEPLKNPPAQPKCD